MGSRAQTGHLAFLNALQLDADERISDDLRKNLRILAEKENVDAYELKWVNTNPEGDMFILGKKIELYKPIFFRKNKLINEGIVHEPTRTTGKLARAEYELHHDHVYTNKNTMRSVYSKKEKLWPKIDAQYRIEIGKASKSRWFYLAKAPLWFVLYVLYYSIYQKYIFAGKRGIVMSFYKGLYNFRLNYNLYKFK